MSDLFPPGLVEMVTEMERDLLARQRIYANRTYTRRLSLERAERRLAIVRMIVQTLRSQMSATELQQLDDAKQQKQKRRQAQRDRKAADGVRLHGAGG